MNGGFGKVMRALGVFVTLYAVAWMLYLAGVLVVESARHQRAHVVTSLLPVPLVAAGVLALIAAALISSLGEP